MWRSLDHDSTVHGDKETNDDDNYYVTTLQYNRENRRWLRVPCLQIFMGTHWAIILVVVITGIKAAITFTLASKSTSTSTLSWISIYISAFTFTPKPTSNVTCTEKKLNRWLHRQRRAKFAQKGNFVGDRIDTAGWLWIQYAKNVHSPRRACM